MEKNEKKRFFVPVLLVYFLVSIVASWFQELVVIKIKIFSDVVFLGLFILQTISMMYYLFMEFTKLEPNLINMLGYAPLIVFFAFWLMRDIKLLKKILSENSMKEFDEKPFN